MIVNLNFDESDKVWMNYLVKIEDQKDKDVNNCSLPIA